MASSTAEYWGLLAPAQNNDPREIARHAAMLEADGWDGGTLVDTQCIATDVYVGLAMAAQATTTLKLAPGVTNPVTRHPAVTASAMASLQVASEGRAVLGIGRGDSALAYLGASPMPIGMFEHYLEITQAYLRGDMVPLAEAAALLTGAEAGYKKIALGHDLPGSWLKWLPDDYEKVPLEVLVTGPKAIGIGARAADYVTFAVGADVARLKWARDLACQEAEKAGRDPATIRFGAMAVAIPHPDIAVARDVASPMTAGMARFSIINRKVVGPFSDAHRKTLERIGGVYEMETHGHGGAQASVLDDDFMDAYALVGPAAQCVERMEEILSLGFDRVKFVTRTADREEGRESYAILVNEVLPALRA